MTQAPRNNGADAPWPRADLYIAAMGRSGSTLLANLLTTPPGRLILVEPYLEQGGANAWMPQQLSRFGWTISQDELKAWATNGPVAPCERFRQVVSHRLEGLQKWGIKEVVPEVHVFSIRTVRPRRMIILTRDIRDVMASYIEKEMREGRGSAQLQERANDVLRSGRQLLDLAATYRQPGSETETRVVRYEDLVGGDAVRKDLEAWLDWPLDGNPSQNMDLYKRSYEVERHQGKVTTGSVGRWQANATVAGICDQIATLMADYQKTFGY